MASNYFIPRPNISSLSLACTLLVALAAPVMRAHADATAAERETARGLMQDGDKLRTAGDLQGALVRYQSAHALMHVPTTGIDVARTQSQLGMLVEARGVALEVANSPAAPNEPRVFSDARNDAVELAAQLEQRVPSLKVLVAPADAPYTVSIDGTTLPTQAREIPFRTNPGPHLVVVEAPGYTMQTRQVSLQEKQAAELPIELPPTAAPAPKPSLAVTSSTLAAPVASTEADRSDPAAGGRIRSIIGFGVGGTALIVGAVTGIMASSKYGDLKTACPDKTCDPSQRDKLDSANTLATVANITIPVGLIGIAYGVFELLTLPSSKPAPEHAHALNVDITGTGVVVRGAL